MLCSRTQGSVRSLLIYILKCNSGKLSSKVDKFLSVNFAQTTPDSSFGSPSRCNVNPADWRGLSFSGDDLD